MPKKVDHHARRILLADALMRVAASRGVEDVSLRHVAAEAGVTAGMVQHYFRTKDEMMIFALGAVRARVQARLGDGSDLAGTGPREMVRALLVQLLPLDADRELEAHVGLAFHAYAAARPDIAADLREDTVGMRAALAERILRAQDTGRVSASIAPELAATGLLALVEGLNIHVLGRHVTAEHALATLDGHLEVLLGAS